MLRRDSTSRAAQRKYRAHILYTVLRLIQAHVDKSAGIAPCGKELWYYDGRQKQFTFQQCKQLVADLYG